jgi:hypothetical protein
MHRSKTAFAILIFLSTLIVGIPPGKAALIEHEFTLERNTYTPTRITFNYEYTHNASIIEITTLGQSLYTHSGGPTFFEFEAQDLDTYRFTFVLSYSKPIEQTIIVGLWSGNRAMDGDSYSTYFEQTVFHVTLHVTAEPSYPSSEQVAQAVTAQISKDLADQQNMITSLMQRLETAQMTTSLVAVVVAVALVVISVIVFTELRKTRRGE